MIDDTTGQELQACPICQGSAEPRVSSDGEIVWIRCLECSRTGPLEYNFEDAVVSWNTPFTASSANAEPEALIENAAKALYLAYAQHPGARWDCVEPRAQEGVWRAHIRAVQNGAIRVAQPTAPQEERRHPGWTEAGHKWLDAGCPAVPDTQPTYALSKEVTDMENIIPLRIDWNKHDLAEAYDLVEGVRRAAGQPTESPLDTSLLAALDAIEAADCEWDGMTKD